MYISDVTAWNYYRVITLATDSLSVASTTWELVIRCDISLKDEEEYLEDEPYPELFIVEIDLSYL